MASGNMWDNSSLYMGDQSGANYAGAIQQVGNAFGAATRDYFEKKKTQEKQEATVTWLEQSGAANNLFPDLAKVQDPAERRKAILAGIKGAGLENLVQVQQIQQQQKRQAQLDKMQAEMQAATLEGAKLNNDRTRQLMAERDTEDSAVRAASDPNAGLTDQIMGGVPFAQLNANAEPDRAALYMRAGGRAPQTIAALGKGRPFSPVEMMTPSGLNMVQTSPNSFIPDPRVRVKTSEPKTSEYERIVAQLDAAGSFDKSPDKLSAGEKALMDRMKALNTRGTSVEAMADAITGGGGQGAQPAASAPDQIPTLTPEQARTAKPGTKFRTTDGRILVKN